LFLWQQALGCEPGWLDDVVRAKRGERLPIVLTREAVQASLAALDDVPWVMAMPPYGSGVRLMECLRSRVKDIEFDRHEIVVREGKGVTRCGTGCLAATRRGDRQRYALRIGMACGGGDGRLNSLGVQGNGTDDPQQKCSDTKRVPLGSRISFGRRNVVRDFQAARVSAAAIQTYGSPAGLVLGSSGDESAIRVGFEERSRQPTQAWRFVRKGTAGIRRSATCDCRGSLAQFEREALLLFWNRRGRGVDGAVHISREENTNHWRRLLAEGQTNL
jgi:hypothetical protein